MQDIICQAIRSRRLLTVHHKNLIRIVEPYALYPMQAGTLILESRLVAGDYENTPPPHWCPIPLAEVTSVTPSDQVVPVHPEYKLNSRRYKQAICRV